MYKTKRKFNGQKLKEMRINDGMTLADLAKELNCDESLVSMWETGDRNPSPRSLKRLSVFFKIAISTLFISLFFSISAYAEIWKVTYYSNDFISCGKTDGITASGLPASPHKTCAVNWLPFGTRIKVGGKLYTVEDHGAKSLFGSKKHHIKHVDIFCASRHEAVKMGVRYLEVER